MVEEVWQQTARADAERFLSFIYNTKQKADRKWARGPDSHSCILPARVPLTAFTASPNGTTRKGKGSHPRAMAPLLIPHHSGCSVTIIVMAVLGLPSPFHVPLFQESMTNYLRVYTLFCLSEFPKGLCCIFRIPTFSCTSPSLLTTSDFVSLSSLEFYHLISELS